MGVGIGRGGENPQPPPQQLMGWKWNGPQSQNWGLELELGGPNNSWGLNWNWGGILNFHDGLGGGNPLSPSSPTNKLWGLGLGGGGAQVDLGSPSNQTTKNTNGAKPLDELLNHI